MVVKSSHLQPLHFPSFSSLSIKSLSPLTPHRPLGSRYDGTAKPKKLVHSIVLELEAFPCKLTSALRVKYCRRRDIIFALLLNFTEENSTLNLFSRDLPKLAEKQSPFDIRFLRLHRRLGNTGSGKHAIKYCLDSLKLQALRIKAIEHFNSCLSCSYIPMVLDVFSPYER